MNRKKKVHVPPPNNLKAICASLELEPKVVLELGAGPRLEADGIIEAFAEVAILIDPVEMIIEAQKKAWKYPNCQLKAFVGAVTPTVGASELVLTPQASNGLFKPGCGRNFLSSVDKAPIETNRPKRRARKNWDKQIVPTFPLSLVDPGNIDLAVIDVEGSEMGVLETMVSRPKVIMIEGGPKHPNWEEMKDWFAENNYTHRDRQSVNHYYVHNG